LSAEIAFSRTETSRFNTFSPALACIGADAHLTSSATT
jgi:hypothetical protein